MAGSKAVTQGKFFWTKHMAVAKALAPRPHPLLSDFISQAPGLLMYKIIPFLYQSPERKHEVQIWSQTDLVLNPGPATH